MIPGLFAVDGAGAIPLLSDVACVYEQKFYKPSYDFDADDSLHKFVSPYSPFANLNYKPVDLVPLENSAYISVEWWVGSLRKEAADALMKMAVEFYEVFEQPISIVSSYRSYAYQKWLFSSYVETHWEAKARWFSAKPWHSEHQLWLAIDVFDLSGQPWGKREKYFQWMREHAHKYGWIQSYQKGIAVDGYIVEPWHWRYVGVDLATYLRENKMTFGEYVKFRWVRGAVAR